MQLVEARGGVSLQERVQRAFATLLASPWLPFAIRRLLSLVLVLFGLALATFAMVRLIPGDPAVNVGGLYATPDQVRAIRHDLGLDIPVTQQFINYWIGLAHLNLGVSFQTNEPVSEVISQRLGESTSLAATSLALVLLLGVPSGLLAAAFTREARHPNAESLFTASTSVLGNLPEFLAATFLAYVFAVALRVLPVAGNEGWQSLVLPALAIALRPSALLSRLVRAEALSVLASDYMRTARSKRLSASVIYVRHLLPNVLTAALAIGGILFAQLIGGAVVVENVFGRLGLGTALVGAVIVRDYPLVQGVILVLGIIVVTVNAVVDVLISIIDPRSVTARA